MNEKLKRNLRFLYLLNYSSPQTPSFEHFGCNSNFTISFLIFHNCFRCRSWKREGRGKKRTLIDRIAVPPLRKWKVSRGGLGVGCSWFVTIARNLQFLSVSHRVSLPSVPRFKACVCIIKAGADNDVYRVRNE